MEYATLRDIDRALAERLFGYVINEDALPQRLERFVDVGKGTLGYNSTPVHFYSEEISEAMECVEKLNPREFDLARTNDTDVSHYAVHIGDGYSRDVYIMKDSASLAICLAVLEYLDLTDATLTGNEEACP